MDWIALIVIPSITFRGPCAMVTSVTTNIGISHFKLLLSYSICFVPFQIWILRLLRTDWNPLCGTLAPSDGNNCYHKFLTPASRKKIILFYWCHFILYFVLLYIIAFIIFSQEQFWRDLFSSTNTICFIRFKPCKNYL